MNSEAPEALLARASALRQAGRVAEAISAYRQLLAIRPDLPDSWYNLGFLQRQARRFEEALNSYSEALRRGVSGPEEVHLNRAVILSDHLGRPREARTELEASLARNPDYLPAWLNLGNLHEDEGRRDAAEAAYRRALDIVPAHPLAVARLAGVARFESPDDPLIARLRTALASPGASPADRADLGFALGRALDQVGAYRQAFDAYRDANASSRQSLGPDWPGYDRDAETRRIDRIIAAFRTPGPPASTAPGEAPIFILGMFRSGSTLAEQIIGRHSRVQPGGELDLVPSLIAPVSARALDVDEAQRLRGLYLEALARIHPGADRVSDKRPDNFLHVGLIKQMFPEARIVHTVRNPLDNLLSVYFLHLDPGMAYALDLEDAAHWHGQYRRLMAHWKSLYPDDIFDFDYDELVADPEPVVRSLLHFLDLEWEPGCLVFQEATNAVKTASAWQVREPLYRRSSGRWRHYRPWLEPLRAMLGEAEAPKG